MNDAETPSQVTLTDFVPTVDVVNPLNVILDISVTVLVEPSEYRILRTIPVVSVLSLYI